MNQHEKQVTSEHGALAKQGRGKSKSASLVAALLWALVVAGVAGAVAAGVTFRPPTALDPDGTVVYLKGGTGVQWEWVVSASAILGALAGVCGYLWRATTPGRE